MYYYYYCYYYYYYYYYYYLDLFPVTTAVAIDPACYSESRDSGLPCNTGSPTFVTRYFFNPIVRECWPFLYTGCGGNANNFFTLPQCEQACLSGNFLMFLMFIIT